MESKWRINETTARSFLNMSWPPVVGELVVDLVRSRVAHGNLNQFDFNTQ